MPARRPVGGRIWLGLAIVFLVPTVLAVPLDGKLDQSLPIEIEGALLVKPGLFETAHGLFEWPDEATASNETFISSNRAIVTVVTLVDSWDSPSLPPEGRPRFQYLGLPPEVKHIDGSGLAISASLVRPAGQLLVQAWTTGLESQELGHTMAKCSVRHLTPEDGFAFPKDPESVREPKATPPSPGSLAGECTVGGLTSPRSRSIFLYGLDLWIVSQNETRFVRTGTLDEPDPLVPAMMRRVTRWVQVQPNVEQDHPPVIVNMTASSNFTFYSPEFVVAGRLNVGPSHGALIWGDDARQGALEPFEAVGTFNVRSNGDAGYHVLGESLSGPPLPPTPSSQSDPSVVGIVGVAASLTLLGLLVRILWPLFSKLLPDRLGDHPRRAQILELARTDPGIQTNEVRRKLGTTWFVATHHIAKLEKGGLVVVRRVGGRTALFPANAGFRGRELQTVLMRRETARRIHNALSGRSGLDRSALASELGLTPRRVGQVLHELTKAGLVRAEPRKTGAAYFAVQAA